MSLSKNMIIYNLNNFIDNSEILLILLYVRAIANKLNNAISF